MAWSKVLTAREQTCILSLWERIKTKPEKKVEDILHHQDHEIDALALQE